jgi:hypothetical protein
VQFPGDALDIDVSPEGVVWIIGTDGTPKIWDWNSSEWMPQPGVSLASISVGSQGQAWGVTSGGVIYRWLRPLPIDQGAWIGVPGNLTAPDVGALGFGTGDFTAAALFQTTSGCTVVSMKSAGSGSPGDAGWLVTIARDATITCTTDNGSGSGEISSAATAALDGQWHHVAAAPGRSAHPVLRRSAAASGIARQPSGVA